MADMTIDEFCDLHGACSECHQWALGNCCSMADAWDKLQPEWLLWVATRPGVLTDKELRISAVNSARSVQHLMEDPRSIAAIDIAEKHALGTATDKEMVAAWEAAWVASEAARESAEAARVASEAAREAAREAAWAAAWAAARAASEAAMEAAWAAAWEAAEVAMEAALAASAQWFRNNTKPNFEGSPNGP